MDDDYLDAIGPVPMDAEENGTYESVVEEDTGGMAKSSDLVDSGRVIRQKENEFGYLHPISESTADDVLRGARRGGYLREHLHDWSGYRASTSRRGSTKSNSRSTAMRKRGY